MNLRLPLLRYVLWVAVFAAVGSGRKSTSQVVGESPSRSTPRVTTATRSPTVAPSTTSAPEAKANQSPSSDLAKVEATVRPSVIWVTAFDPKGNLLRTESGFFISADGRFVATTHAIEGAVNAVAKTADGGIYNVSGVLAASKPLELAILQADVKPRRLVRFLEVNRSAELTVGGSVAVVGSPLAGNEAAARETTVTAQDADRFEIAGATAASSVGAPVVDDNGGVIGVITLAGDKTIARPAIAVESVLSRVAIDTQPRWPEIAEARPTPHATPKPRLVYAPAPAFPPMASLPGASGTGRFRLSFDAQGNVTNIQLVQSTGNRAFDESAIRTLRQWKCSPGQGWAVTVPVTFRTR
jgi:TonB family protein